MLTELKNEQVYLTYNFIIPVVTFIYLFLSKLPPKRLILNYSLLVKMVPVLKWLAINCCLLLFFQYQN